MDPAGAEASAAATTVVARNAHLLVNCSYCFVSACTLLLLFACRMTLGEHLTVIDSIICLCLFLYSCIPVLARGTKLMHVSCCGRLNDKTACFKNTFHIWSTGTVVGIIGSLQCIQPLGQTHRLRVLAQVFSLYHVACCVTARKGTTQAC